MWFSFVHWSTGLVNLVPWGTPAAKGAANKQDLAERLKLWFVRMRTGIYTG